LPGDNTRSIELDARGGNIDKPCRICLSKGEIALSTVTAVGIGAVGKARAAQWLADATHYLGAANTGYASPWKSGYRARVFGHAEIAFGYQAGTRVEACLPRRTCSRNLRRPACAIRPDHRDREKRTALP
jgi:hypothetical protein